MKKLMIAIIATALCGFLAGCNTVDGFGKDLSSGGKALSSSAEKHGAKNNSN